MAIRYKNPQTGEYEVIKIPVMKGEQGHAGIHVGTDAPPTTDVKLWFDPSDTDNDVDLANRLDTTLTACYDYMGNDRGSIKAAADANVDWLLGEINTAHYEGQHITALDSIAGQAKNAVVEGQTLVNVYDYTSSTFIGGATIENGVIILKANGGWVVINNKLPMLKPNTNYTVFVNILSNTLNYSSSSDNYALLIEGSDDNTGFNRGYQIPNNSVGIFKKLLTTKESFSTTHLSDVRIHPNANDGEIKFTYMIIEGDHTQEDIPYFEGMTSVKAPVLTTVGKNLFDGILKQGYIGDNTGEVNTSSKEGVHSPNYMRVKPNTTYIRTISGSYPSRADGRVYFYDINKTYLRTYKNSATFITPENAQYMRFRYYVGSEGITPNDFSESNIQIEEGSTATPYEPYKSNILTVNEEVTLRGIGNVKDELDVATGELTQRIEEIVLDGSQSRDYNYTGVFDSVYRIGISHSEGEETVLETQRIGCCDKLPSVYDWTGDYEHFYIGKTAIILFINKEKIGELNDENVKKYFAQNPTTIQYELATPTIKTVDLSDNHVYSYKGTTHYDCSSAEGSLVPTLSIDVPTNLSALVTKQRQQIRTLEEENKELNQELQLAIASSEEGDNELLAQSFELDFRLMEVECALDLPMAATFRLGGKAMAMTPYEMAKKLILADNYDRADMEHKLEVYVSKKRMTEAERQELIQLMDEKEGIITIDPVEPEVEESVIEHEAVTIPLH